MPSKSKKQARLMAAVAHNPKFAKKVGIPQSVGQEFYAADKSKGRYAEGGKVKNLRKLSRHIKYTAGLDEDIGSWEDLVGAFGGINSKGYSKLLGDWDPEMTADELRLMDLWVDGRILEKRNPEEFARINDLIKKYGIRPGVTLYRGLSLLPDQIDSIKAGDYLTAEHPQSVSLSRLVASGYAHEYGDYNKMPVVLRVAPSQRKALPIPHAGDSELVVPAGGPGRFGVDKILPPNRLGEVEIEVDPVPHPGFADGGKVGTIARIQNMLRNRSVFGDSDPLHSSMVQAWKPEEDIKDEDLDLIGEWVSGVPVVEWEKGNPKIDKFDRLIKKYGIRPRERTFRGLGLPAEMLDDYKPGDFLYHYLPQGITTDKKVAEEFAKLRSTGWADTSVLMDIAPSNRLALPIPNTRESELVMPSAEAGKLLIDKIHRLPKSKRVEISAETVPHPGFAGGGQVLPSSTDDEESWADTYIKRPLSGLASMWGGTDPETGEFVNPVWHNLKRSWNLEERRRQGLPDQPRSSLGIVDETVSLPALGQIVGLPAPNFATEAEERASATREAARQSLGLDAPHGFTENIAESAGVMAGQLPVPASVANRLKLLKTSGRLGKAGKILGPAAEWFSPTVVPSKGNYTKGTLFGGTLGGALDYLSDYIDEQEQHRQWISEAMAEVLAEEMGSEDTDEEALSELGYAEGGRVKAAKSLISNLRGALDQTEDKETRKALIDAAVRSINTPGVELPFTTRAQLHATRDETGLTRLLEEAAPLLQEARPVTNFDPGSLIKSPPPPLVRPAEAIAAGWGSWDPEEYNKTILKRLYHNRGANPELADEMALLDQEDKDWNKMFGYAEGGQVGAPQSQEWYETYGQGPEHQFFGERRLPELKDWSPIAQARASTPAPSGGGSSALGNALNLGALGLIGYDIYKDIRGNQGGLDSIDPSILEGAGDTSATNEWINQDLASMEMPTAEFDPTVWDRTKQGAGGALDLYIGSQQGGIEGAGNMLSGSGDIYQALGGSSPYGQMAGDAGGILQGIGDGTVEGYIQAGGDAAQLAQKLGYSGPLFDKAGKLLPIVGDLFSAYQGIKSGNPAGYAQAAGSAYSAASAAGLAPTTGALASSGLSTAAPLAAVGFTAAALANKALGVGKKGAYLDAYLDSLGGRAATVKEARKMPGGSKMGYYILPDGSMVSNKELKGMYEQAGSPFGEL